MKKTEDMVEVVIYIEEDRKSTINYLEYKLKNGIFTRMKERHGVLCTLGQYTNLDDLKTKVDIRVRDSEQDGKHYLSVCIFDLVDIDKKNGKSNVFCIPNIAIDIVKNDLIPLCERYKGNHLFSSIILTNVFNYCKTEYIDKPNRNGKSLNTPEEREKIVEIYRELKSLVANMNSRIIHKKESERRAEGRVDCDGVIRDLEYSLFVVIQEAMMKLHEKSPFVFLP